VGVNNPGLSCVLVQGLLFPGYAYRVSALRAIPGSTLERENHLRIAYPFLPEVIILGSVVLPRIISVSQLSTDRHSITLPFGSTEWTLPDDLQEEFTRTNITTKLFTHSIPNSLLIIA